MTVSNGTHGSVPLSEFEDEEVITPRLSVTPPPPQMEPDQMRNAAKVQALKHQFLSKGQEAVSRQADVDEEKKSRSTKVKTIVKQMTIPTADSEKSVSPPPSSPVDKDLEEVRKHVAIAEKITHLHQSVDRSMEKKHSSYKPSTLRRKVNSPFLDSDGNISSSSSSPESAKKGEKIGEMADEVSKECLDPQCALSATGRESTDLHVGEVASDNGVEGEMGEEEETWKSEDVVGESAKPEAVEKDMSRILVDSDDLKHDREASQLHSENPVMGELEDSRGQELTVATATAAVSATAEVSDEPRVSNGLSEHLANHEVQEDIESNPDTTASADPVTKERDPEVSSAFLPDAHPDSSPNTREENEYSANPSRGTTPVESRSPAHSSTPYDYRMDRKSREKSYDSSSLASSGSSYDRRRMAMPSREEEEDIYKGSSYIVEGEKDDDHLVSIVLPFRSATSKKKKDGQYSSGSMYTPSGSIYNSGRRKRRPEPTPPPLPPPRRSSNNALSVDDVFISFNKSSKDDSHSGKGRKKMHRAGSDGKPSHIADVLADVRENGVLSKLSDADQDQINATYAFDRLSGGPMSEYDHLPPLEVANVNTSHTSRPRTTSDVSSHRTRSRKAHVDFTSSAVRG